MKKEKPRVFANKINKKLENNDTYAVTKNEENRESNVKYTKENKNINQKINDIFKSTDYIYKADVEIVLKDKTISKRIIGKKSDSLITMDNELIPISEIRDIYRK